MSEQSLTAFYDLEVAPISFDFSVFLVLAENQRRQLEAESLRVVIVPGSEGGFRREDAGYEIDNKKWRLQNIVVPLTTLLEIDVSLDVCDSREAAKEIEDALAGPVFPQNYTVSEPISEFFLSSAVAVATLGNRLPTLTAPIQARTYMRDWLHSHIGERKGVTITLRESTYNENRNSDLSEWLAFAKSMNPDIYCPIFVRDTERCFEPLGSEFDNLVTCPIASVNLPLRMALYEESWVNMMVPNGPGELCRLSENARYLYFKVINEDADTASKLIVASQGIEIGGQLPFASKFQKLVWEPDEQAVLEREFYSMASQINATGEKKDSSFEPTQTRSPMETAVQLQMTGRTEDAMSIYQHLVQEDPNNADAWHFLAIIAHQADSLEVAEKFALRAISIKNDSPNFFVTAARIERDLEKFEEAMQALLSAISLDAEDAGAYADLAELLHVKGELHEAESAMMRALQLAPETVEFYERAAKMLHTNGNTDEAAAFYRKALDLRDLSLEESKNRRRHMSEIPRVMLGTN